MEQQEHNNVIYMALGPPDVLLEGSKSFSGFAAGTWETFLSEIEIKESELNDYRKNTLVLIEARKGKGEAGLPIDAKGHNHGEAAGWITGVKRSKEINSNGEDVPVLKFDAKWTELGVHVLSERLVTNFSPEFYTDEKVIVGGSLTNWPATMDENKVPIFSAVQLSKGVGMLENLRAKIMSLFDELKSKVKNELEDETELEHNGGTEMADELTLEQLSEEEREYLLDQARKAAFADLGVEGTPEEISAKLKKRVDVDALKALSGNAFAEAFFAEAEKVADEHFEQLEVRSAQMLQQKLAEMNKKREIVSFCNDVTGGTKSVPYGLRVERVELENVLAGLDEGARVKVQALLKSTWEHGRVDFGEIGHGNEPKHGNKRLSDLIAEQLKVAIGDGSTIEEFFKAAGEELAPQADYDLRGFVSA